MRRWLTFEVAGATCAATLNEGDHWHGLLIVSGGNEVRCGAHRGMALLAAEIAATGHPVLRFDRRGVGDSEGANGGFAASGADIAAALALFRVQCPTLTKITAFGNCDAATALIMHDDAVGADALLLANPWTIDAALPGDADEEAQGLPPAAAIRARYRAKLRQPREWLRLIGGGVNLRMLARGLMASRRGGASSRASLAAALIAGLTAIDDRRVQVLVAERDGTGQAFLATWRSDRAAPLRSAPNVTLVLCDTASHSFADDRSSAWLTARILQALE